MGQTGAFVVCVPVVSVTSLHLMWSAYLSFLPAMLIPIFISVFLMKDHACKLNKQGRQFTTSVDVFPDFEPFSFSVFLTLFPIGLPVHPTNSSLDKWAGPLCLCFKGCLQFVGIHPVKSLCLMKRNTSFCLYYHYPLVASQVALASSSGSSSSAMHGWHLDYKP